MMILIYSPDPTPWLIEAIARALQAAKTENLPAGLTVFREEVGDVSPPYVLITPQDAQQVDSKSTSWDVVMQVEYTPEALSREPDETLTKADLKRSLELNEIMRHALRGLNTLEQLPVQIEEQYPMGAFPDNESHVLELSFRASWLPPESS